jgi:NTP pyrophosphatase (non-canonical NTP hydrolase)
MELNELTAKIISFRDARDWKQFHKPNHLASAISIEAAELLEHFLWKSPDAVEEKVKDEAERGAIAEELADIFIFSLLLAHELGVDPFKIVSDKLGKNELKYPSEAVRGSSKKYSEYD